MPDRLRVPADRVAGVPAGVPAGARDGVWRRLWPHRALGAGAGQRPARGGVWRQDHHHPDRGRALTGASANAFAVKVKNGFLAWSGGSADVYHDGTGWVGDADQPSLIPDAINDGSWHSVRVTYDGTKAVGQVKVGPVDGAVQRAPRRAADGAQGMAGHGWQYLSDDDDYACDQRRHVERFEDDDLRSTLGAFGVRQAGEAICGWFAADADQQVYDNLVGAKLKITTSQAAWRSRSAGMTRTPKVARLKVAGPLHGGR